MSGLFGIYLEFLYIVGGIVLWILIGGKGRTKTEDARSFRLAAGAISVGAVGGSILFWMFNRQSSYLTIIATGGIIGMIISGAFTGLLEWIRGQLDK